MDRHLVPVYCDGMARGAKQQSETPHLVRCNRLKRLGAEIDVKVGASAAAVDAAAKQGRHVQAGLEKASHP